MGLSPCLECGAPSSGPRCAEHAKPVPYATAEYQAGRAQCLAEERECWLCGESGTEENPLEADHVVEVANGGSSDRSNLRAACRRCNRRRGARLGNGL